MKRLIVLLIIFVIISAAAFSGTSSLITGMPTADTQSSVNVGFTYDPATMVRLTFGFTQDNDLSWFDNDGDLSGTQFNLISKSAEYDWMSGVGTVNFYWKLRTPDAVNAKIYLASPLKDERTGNELDWKIVFTSELGKYIYPNESVDSVYGPANAKPIFSKEADPEFKVLVDYIPVEISTDTIRNTDGKQLYCGTIGVIVDIV